MPIKPIQGVSLPPPSVRQLLHGLRRQATVAEAYTMVQMLRRGLVLDLSVAFGELVLSSIHTLLVPSRTSTTPAHKQHLERTDTLS